MSSTRHLFEGARLPTLVAGHVTLRWLEERDVDDLFAIYSNPEVMRYWSRTPYQDRGEAAALVETIHRQFERRELFEWGIVRTSDDRVVGTCTLFNIDQANLRAEIGYVLGRAHWGNGYAQAAVGRLIALAVDECGLQRLEADVDPRNTPSIRVLERHGFQREGLLRERWLVNGEWQDSAMYGLLARERSVLQSK